MESILVLFSEQFAPMELAWQDLGRPKEWHRKQRRARESSSSVQFTEDAGAGHVVELRICPLPVSPPLWEPYRQAELTRPFGSMELEEQNKLRWMTPVAVGVDAGQNGAW